MHRILFPLVLVLFLAACTAAPLPQVPVVTPTNPPPTATHTPLPTSTPEPTPTFLPGGPSTDTSLTDVLPTSGVVGRDALQNVRTDNVFLPINPSDPESTASNVISQYNLVASELNAQGFSVVSSPDSIRSDTDVFLTGIQDGQEWTIGGFTNKGFLWAASGPVGQETLLYNPADMREGTFDHFTHIVDGYEAPVSRRYELVNSVWTAVVRDLNGNLLAFRNPASGEF